MSLIPFFTLPFPAPITPYFLLLILSLSPSHVSLCGLPSSRLLLHLPYFFTSSHPSLNLSLCPILSLLPRTCSWWLPWALLGADGLSSPQGCRVASTSSTWPSPQWGQLELVEGGIVEGKTIFVIENEGQIKEGAQNPLSRAAYREL